MLSRETLQFCIPIALSFGLILGYAWRMAQIDEHKTEKTIVEALKGCEQLITEELIIVPSRNCDKLKTAILGLRKGTFYYLQTKEGRKRHDRKIIHER